MTAPVVSVVTTAYNAGGWIRGAICSTLGQTLGDFEYIVVNDGSLDNTQEILEQYQGVDERLTVVEQSNQGVAPALNRAIRLSEGKYIAILDADDLSLPRRLELEAQFLDAHPEHGMVGGLEIGIDTRVNKIWLVRYIGEDSDLRRSWVWRNKFAHSAVMMRRDVLERIGLYDESMKVGFDPDLWARIASRYRVANIQEPVVVRRHHSGSLARSARRARLFTQLKLNAKAVRRLSLPRYDYLALILPLIYSVMPYKVVRRIRRGFRQEGLLTLEELEHSNLLRPGDVNVVRMAFDTP